jgi:tetratricopeptide (TPR) repeat protein
MIGAAGYGTLIKLRERMADRCLTLHADLSFDDADRCYTMLERLAPGEWRWPYYRALIASERSDTGTTLDALRAAAARAPGNGLVWLRLGESEFKAGRSDQARDAWQRAVTASDTIEPPPDAPPHAGYATIAAAASGRLARLSASSQSVGGAARPRAFPDPQVDALTLRSRSVTFLLQQATMAPPEDIAWRELLLRRAVDVDPASADALLALAKHERRVNRCDTALDLLRRYEQISPGDAAALIEQGGCLLAKGRADDAEPLLRRALGLGLDDAATHYSLGVVLARLGRSAEAQAEYAEALHRDPDHVDARNNLAIGLARMGRLDDAVSELKQALATDPTRADTHSNLGVVLASLGRRDEAKRSFEEALRLDPRLGRARAGLESLKQ